MSNIKRQSQTSNFDKLSLHNVWRSIKTLLSSKGKFYQAFKLKIKERPGTDERTNGRDLVTLSLLELLIAAKNKLELKLCLNLAKSVYICLFGHAVAQGVILPTGVRAFPAGNSQVDRKYRLILMQTAFENKNLGKSCLMLNSNFHI